MCGIPAENLPFHLFGLCLQQPMGLLFNWLICLTCLVFYQKVKQTNFVFLKNCRYFFLTLGISTFFGGLGHLFFYYCGFYGKILPFSLGIVSSFFVAKAMLNPKLLKRSTLQALTFFLYA